MTMYIAKNIINMKFRSHQKIFIKKVFVRSPFEQKTFSFKQIFVRFLKKKKLKERFLTKVFHMNLEKQSSQGPVMASKRGHFYQKCHVKHLTPSDQYFNVLPKEPHLQLIPTETLDECTKTIKKEENTKKSSMFSHKQKEKNEYYTNLEGWIKEMGELDEIQVDSPIETDENEASDCVRFATYTSFCINVLLLCAKSLALHSSQSYTIISSLCDSCLDLIAGVVISYTAANSKFTKDDIRDYPIGKSRISIVGILVFSILMGCCALYIIIQCLMSILAHERAPNTTHIAMHVMQCTIFTKFIMAILYRFLHHPITDTLADDHRNDVMTNSFGLFMYWGGEHCAWWMDSTGGIIISLFVLVNWTKTAIENATMLVGRSGTTELERAITYVSASHSKLIQSVEKVVVYQVGSQYFAEVHIIVPGTTPTKESHDVGEALQLKLERMHDVERAFVHIDTENNSPIEHVLDQRLMNQE